MSECGLCTKDNEVLHEDDVCWITYCKSHPDKILIVLNRHTRFPMPQEKSHMELVVFIKFPRKKFRDDCPSVPEHYHIHEE